MKGPGRTALVALTLHQPNQIAKTLPHTEMENLTLYVILAAVFGSNEKVGIRSFLSVKDGEKQHIHSKSLLCYRDWLILRHNIYISSDRTNMFTS